MKYHRHLLESCVDALNGIFFEDRHADKSIEYYLRNNKKWGSRDRRFFAETVYDCVRWWTLYWYLLDQNPRKADMKILAPSFWMRDMPLPDEPEFKNLNCIAFKNRYDSLKEPHLKQAFPEWLYQHILQELGEQWHKWAPFFNQTNKLVLRVNSQKADLKTVMASLQKDSIEAKPLSGTNEGLIVEKRANVFRTDAFQKGFFEVQDGSSQQVAQYLEIEPGMRVIDACAGAGGKSLHIADLLDNKGKVISLDIHQWKLDQLKLRARRAGVSNIEGKAIENSKVVKRLKGQADRLLLDVPCSGLGVLKRNPDTKWKLSMDRLIELQQIQRDILQQYSAMLKPGGLMVYSTCSVLPSENENQVDEFLKANPNFTRLKQRHIYPVKDGFDGFYMALLKKQ